MSGEGWNEGNNSTNARGGPDVPDHVDDDFGDFEGFEDVDQLGASVAQPLPESLQANWASFPDYVPSQHTMSSSLQPDLLPMQANLSDALENTPPSRIGQELNLPDVNTNPAVITCRESNRASSISGDLPDVSPPHRPYSDASGLELPLEQPDLAGPDFQRNASSALQSNLPDVSPQAQINNLGHLEFPDVNNLLPDVSPVTSRGVGSSYPQLDVPSAKSQTLPFNLSCGSSATSIQNSTASSETLVLHKTPVLPTAPQLPSLSLQLQPESCSTGGGIEEQVQRLWQQNERLIEEMREIKDWNVQLQRMLTECLTFIRTRQNNSKECEVTPSLEGEIQQLTEVMVELKAEMQKQKTNVSTNSLSDVEPAIVAFKENFESTLAEQKKCLDSIQQVVTQQEQSTRHLADKVQEKIFSQLDNHLKVFREQILEDVQKMLKDNSVDSETRSGTSESINAVNKAIEAFTLQMEEQKKRDERSTLVFTILDSLLMNTRRQIQELLKPKNSPNS